MAAINDVLKVNTKGAAPLNANAPAEAASAQVSNFVTVQSLGTFAVAVPVLKTIWELIKALKNNGGWANSFWTPFVICLVYAVWQLTVSVSGMGLSWQTGQRSKTVIELSSALVISIANAAIVAAAVIGLTQTVK